MKPFYSIDELASIFSEDCYQIADALLACNVPLIHDGGNANLSRWRRPVHTGSDGSRWVTTGTHPVPNPDQVVVSSDALPESWVLAIKDAELRNEQESDQELERSTNDAQDSLGKRLPIITDNTLISTIAALLAAWPKGKWPSGKELEQAAESVGVSISDDSIRKALDAAIKLATRLKRSA